MSFAFYRFDTRAKTVIAVLIASTCIGIAQGPGRMKPQRLRPQRPVISGVLDVLRNAIRAQNRLRYSGERVVELVVNGDRKVLTEYILRNGAQSRTTYPDDSPRKGFVIVENGGERWEFDPNRNEIRRQKARREETLLLMGGMMKAAQEGRLRIASFEGGTIAGAKAFGITVSDAQGNVARRLWIDPAMGMILKAEQYGRVGQLLAAFEFRRVNYNPVIRDGDFGPIKRGGAKVVNEAQDFNVPWNVMTPTWLPQGFSEVSRGLRRFRGRPVVLILFTDGRRQFSVFQSQGSAPQIPPRQANRAINMRMSRSGDVWSVAVGGMDGETLDRVVQSIGRR